MTTDVRYPSADGEITAALARPKGDGAWPAVIMQTDIWGLRDVYRDMAERLAGAGYVVLVPDLYHRLGADRPKGREDFAAPGVRARAMAWKDSLTRPRITSDMAAAIAFLDKQPFVHGPRLGVVGYCMSGPIAMWTAAAFRDRVAAAASFHGGGLVTDSPDSPHRLAGLYSAELYFGHADKDMTATPAMIATLEAALTAAHARFTSVLYAGAMHGYAVADGESYDPAAAERHWAALTALMKRNV